MAQGVHCYPVMMTMVGKVEKKMDDAVTTLWTHVDAADLITAQTIADSFETGMASMIDEIEAE